MSWLESLFETINKRSLHSGSSLSRLNVYLIFSINYSIFVARIRRWKFDDRARRSSRGTPARIVIELLIPWDCEWNCIRGMAFNDKPVHTHVYYYLHLLLREILTLKNLRLYDFFLGTRTNPVEKGNVNEIADNGTLRNNRVRRVN